MLMHHYGVKEHEDYLVQWAQNTLISIVQNSGLTCHFADSYAKARTNLKRAEETSDICSDIENVKPRKRKLVYMQL